MRKKFPQFLVLPKQQAIIKVYIMCAYQPEMSAQNDCHFRLLAYE